MEMSSMSKHSDTFQTFPGEKAFQQSPPKGSISAQNTTILSLTPGWESFQIYDTARVAESTVQRVSSTTEPSTFGVGPSLNFFSHAILPNYNDNILIPRESEVDREEATIDLSNVSRLLSYAYSYPLIGAYIDQLGASWYVKKILARDSIT